MFLSPGIGFLWLGSFPIFYNLRETHRFNARIFNRECQPGGLLRVRLHQSIRKPTKTYIFLKASLLLLHPIFAGRKVR